MVIQRTAIRGHLTREVARVGRQLVDGRQFFAHDPDRERIAGPLLLEPVDRRSAVAADRVRQIGAVALLIYVARGPLTPGELYLAYCARSENAAVPGAA